MNNRSEKCQMHDCHEQTDLGRFCRTCQGGPATDHAGIGGKIAWVVVFVVLMSAIACAFFTPVEIP